MATLRIINRVNGIVSTTDATQTVVTSFVLPSSGVCQVEANIQGKDSSNNGIVAKLEIATTSTTGTGTLIGSPTNVITALVSVALVGASVTADISTNTLRILVTGKLATSIDWFCDLTIWEN